MITSSRIKTAIASLLFSLGALALLHPSQSHAKCLSKIDLGPAYIHLDVLHEKQTIKELDMAGIRADFSAVFGNGWVIKPTALYGKAHDGELTAFGAGFGRCVPVMDCLILTPQVGLSYSNLNTTIHLDLGPMGEVKYRERFRALVPYVALEAIFKLAKDWRLCVTAQYGWSHSKTRVKELFSKKSDSEGPNFGVLLE